MNKENVELKIEFKHVENKNTREMIDGVKSLLEVEKAKGNLDFKTVTIRKCDYCERTLTEGDKFKTETLENGNIMDKCEDCESRGKKDET